MKLLSQHIESLIFTAEKPIKLKEIKSILEETFETKFKNADLEGAIEEIEKRYEGNDHAFEMVGIAEGYQFLTKGSYFNTVATFLKQTTRKRLSRAALETLSIIAYKQPVSRPELERIRGVSCDYAIHKLLEKEMVTILGRSESVGKPLLYGTSVKFMDYFGLKSLNDMPKPRDFSTPENSIGEAAPIEEDTPNPNAKPPLELPITDLEEVVDMLVAILPPGPKVEIPESEEELEEDTLSPNGQPQLELPITDLEEVVDMIAAILPPGPKNIISESEVTEEESKAVDKLEAKGEAASEMPQASNAKQTPQGNALKEKAKLPIVPIATASSQESKDKEEESAAAPTIAQLFAEATKPKPSSEPTKVEKVIPTIPSQESKDKEEESAAAPTIAQLFAEATKPRPSSEPTKVEKVIPTIPSQESKDKEEESAAAPTIAQLFAEATKAQSSSEPAKEEKVIPTIPSQEAKSSDDLEGMKETKHADELDEVIDVITASLPIENIPSESIVLEELISKDKASSEEE